MTASKPKALRSAQRDSEMRRDAPGVDERDSWLLPLAQEDAEIMRMLLEPAGTPITLTDDQAAAILRAGIGARKDLPSGSQYVKSIKKKVWSPD